MDQLNLFDFEVEVIVEETSAPDNNLFQPEKAHWHDHPVFGRHTREKFAQVNGIIPETVKAPSEINWFEGSYHSPDFGEVHDKWCAYVWSVSQLIPYDDREPNDANGWDEARRMVRKAREDKTPIRISICETYVEQFNDLEIVEYLPAPENLQ